MASCVDKSPPYKRSTTERIFQEIEQQQQQQVYQCYICHTILQNTSISSHARGFDAVIIDTTTTGTTTDDKSTR
jgi:hypothetical protein